MSGLVSPADTMTDSATAAGTPQPRPGGHDVPVEAPASPAALATALRGTGYLADDGLATTAWLALRMQPAAAARGRAGHRQDRAGRGAGRGARPRSWSGCSATRASTRSRPSTTGTSRGRSCICARSEATRADGTGVDVDAVEQSLFDERFLLARPVAAGAPQSHRACCWSTRSTAPTTSSRRSCSRCCPTNAVTIPELGTIRADQPPVVVLTSNRTREVHDALKRRCLYHWVDAPRRSPARSRSCAPGCRRCPTALAGRSPRAVHRMRDERRPAQAARRRRDASTGRGRSTSSARARPRRGDGRDHARRRAEVPRGRRPGTRLARPAAGRLTVTAAETANRRPRPRSTPSSSASPARCARPGCR